MCLRWNRLHRSVASRGQKLSPLPIAIESRVPLCALPSGSRGGRAHRCRLVFEMPFSGRTQRNHAKNAEICVCLPTTGDAGRGSNGLASQVSRFKANCIDNANDYCDVQRTPFECQAPPRVSNFPCAAASETPFACFFRTLQHRLVAIIPTRRLMGEVFVRNIFCESAKCRYS